MSPKPLVIPVFIPHEGCPHRCVFCNQVSITDQKTDRVTAREVAERIAAFLKHKGPGRGDVEVAFYGGNFLSLAAAHRNALLSEAQRFIDSGQVDGIRFSTRPETITGPSLKALQPYQVLTIEVGAQSMDEQVLLLSRRGHTAKDTEAAVTQLRSCGFRVGLQIMPGLPGDTARSILDTGRRIAGLKPDFVRIYPTVVVKDTVLEHWYRAGRFTPLSLADAVELAKRLYTLFRAQGISVIRMGLQATESLSASRALVAGPFHPAFGHLVHAACFLDKASRAIEAQKGALGRVTIRAHPRDVSKVRGIKNQNVMELTRRFDLPALEVLADPGVPRETLRVEADTGGA